MVLQSPLQKFGWSKFPSTKKKIKQENLIMTSIDASDEFKLFNLQASLHIWLVIK